MHLPFLLYTTLLLTTTTTPALAKALNAENPVVGETRNMDPAPPPPPAPAPPADYNGMDCTTFETDSCSGGKQEHKGMVWGRNVTNPNMNSIQCNRALRDHEQIDLSTHPGKRDLGELEGDEVDGVEGRNASEGVVGGGRIYAELDGEKGERDGNEGGKGDKKRHGNGPGVWFEKRGDDTACNLFVESVHGDVTKCTKFPKSVNCINFRRDESVRGFGV